MNGQSVSLVKLIKCTDYFYALVHFFLSAIFQLRGHRHSGCWAMLTQEALSHMETSKNEHSAVGNTMSQSVPLCLPLFLLLG